MNWDAIGSIGEVIGALAVMMSLAYLARQIRGQNRESRLSAISELTNQINEVMSTFVAKPKFTETYLKGLENFESLDDVERVQFSTFIGRFFRIGEGFFDYYEDGHLSPEKWASVENWLKDVCRYPGVKAWWPTRSHWYNRKFGERLTLFLASKESPTMYARPAAGDNQR